MEIWVTAWTLCGTMPLCDTVGCCCHAQVRNQRNRFVALIASARQAATEMTDRLRLLSSEQEILAAEVATKAQLLDKVCCGGRGEHPFSLRTCWCCMVQGRVERPQKARMAPLRKILSNLLEQGPLWGRSAASSMLTVVKSCPAVTPLPLSPHTNKHICVHTGPQRPSPPHHAKPSWLHALSSLHVSCHTHAAKPCEFLEFDLPHQHRPAAPAPCL